MKNIVMGILAHVDAGKTTLSEAMLYESGKLKKLGRVDHKDAYLDTDFQERKRGITIFSKQALFSYGDLDITLLDTPGHVDFSAEMERSLQVLDYAVLVISGSEGVQSHTETLWKLLGRYNIPTFIFVNKMDMPGTDKENIMADLKKNLDEACVDMVEEDAYEQIALCEEVLLDKFLENGKLSENDIKEVFKSRKVFPCFFGSALKLDGVRNLLVHIARYMEPVSYPDTFGARVYKISRDEKGERLTFLKITGGALKCRDVISGHDGKVNSIRMYSGARYETVTEAFGGNICAITGIDDTYAGEGLGFEGENVLGVLEPVLSYKLIYPADKDGVTVLKDIKQLSEEIPELHASWNEDTKEIYLMVMGQIQIQVVTEMVRDRYGYDITLGTGKILYKETITKPVMGVGHFEPLKHYAEVHLLMEPLPLGSGLQFDSICSEDMLAKNWQRLVLNHLEERVQKGVLTGAPITDMKITLTAGRAHQKHTEGGDFRQATYRAIRQGLMMGETRLLEPIYSFRLKVPSDMTGRAMNDITRMEGHFTQPEIENDMTIITGEAPVYEMQDYQTEVVAYTHGLGKLSLTYAGYAPCHNEEEIILESGYEPEQDVAHPVSSVFCAHGAGYIVDWYDVYEYMHVKEDVGFSLAGMDEYIKEHLSIQEMEAIEDNKRRAASAKRSGDVVYNEKELEDIFVRTYGKAKESAACNKAGFNRYHKRKSADYEDLSGTPADRGLTKPGVYKKQNDGIEYLLVDGYNIIFAWDELKELAAESLAGARDRLIDIMSNYQGYMGCELILVFDAYKVKQNDGSITKYDNIYVVYTKEAETADMYIEKTTHRLGRKHKVTVATSDALEQLIIMGQGALRMSARGLKDEVERVNALIHKSMGI